MNLKWNIFAKRTTEYSQPAWYGPTENAAQFKIAYIHGFNSGPSPESDKVRLLSLIAPVLSFGYDSFATYPEIMSSLEFQSSREELPLVFIGTSLGGFYASELGRVTDRPSVIINPCTKPYTMLSFAVHLPMKNFVTGELASFSMESRSSYRGREVSEKNDHRHKPLLLVDLDDELLPASKTFAELGSFPKIAFSGGCHRFAHMLEALDPIRRYIVHCDR